MTQWRMVTATVLFAVVVAVTKSLEIPTGLVQTQSSTVTFATNPAVKQKVSLTLRNYGDKTATDYFVAVPPEWTDSIAFVGVRDKSGRLNVQEVNETVTMADYYIDSQGKKVKLKRDISEQVSQSRFYRVKLPGSGLPADGGKSSLSLNITLGLMHVLQPLPKKIRRTSKQLIYFTTNRYFYSPYFTKSLAVKFVLSTDKFKSTPKPIEKSAGNRLTYASVNSVKPFSKDWMNFHFEWKGPILTITEMVRDIEVSHWGNVRFEDRFLIKHDGAKLDGPYEPGTNRRYMRIRDPAVVEGLDAYLPRAAHGVYYNDRIGNISSSHFRRSRSRSILELAMRYPLYGGWKTDFTIGYDVPSNELIEIVSDGNGNNNNQNSDVLSYRMNLTFGVPMREPVTDLLTTQIALPEGAFDVEIDCPFDIDQEPMGRRFTYLDSKMLGGGRPLIIFHKRNVIHLHNEYYQITYKLRSSQLYLKPALLIFMVFSFFLTVTFVMRLNPTLTSEEDLENKRQLIESSLKASLYTKKGSKKSGRVSTGSSSNGGSAGESNDNNAKKIRISRVPSEVKQSLRDLRTQFMNSNNSDAASKVGKALKKLNKFKGNQDRINEIVDSLESQLNL